MRENTKFIVAEVNKILNRNYNIIQFNALTPENLLEVLKDVLVKLQEENGRKDAAIEAAREQSAIYVLSVLRILNYQPQVDPVTFRRAVIQGDSETLQPIFTWLFTHLDIVRARLYLSRFLVKLDIPIEYLGDTELAALHEQYTGLIENFKAAHKEREAGKKNVQSANELTADLRTMEKEKEAVTIRIEKMKAKAKAGVPYLLEAARALRIEKEKERDLALEREQEVELLSRLEIALQRIEREIEILKKDGNEVTAEAVLQHLSEVLTVQSIVVNEKLPTELNLKRNRMRALSQVREQSYCGPDQIASLRSRLDNVAKEIQDLVERKISNDSIEKIEPFRQQAAAVANIKRNALERLENAENSVKELEAKLEEKREFSRHMEDTGTLDIVPRGAEELKKYVSRLKTKSTLYKHCKGELAGLSAENSLLKRTAAILENRLNQCNQEKIMMEPLEREALANLTVENGYSLNLQLARKISALRVRLLPLLTEVQNLREKSQDSENRFKKISKSSNAAETSISNEVHNLLSDIGKLKAQIAESIAEKEKLEKETNRMKLFEERIKYDTDNANPEEKMKEELRSGIQAEESRLKELSLKKTAVVEEAMKNEKQARMWDSLASIFESKLLCAERNKQSDGIVFRRGGAETLVLQ